MPTPTEAAAATAVNGIFYVVGGYNTSGYLADTQIYNLSTNSWSAGAALPAATRGGVLAAASGKLYFIGGYTSAGSTNAVWVYTPKTNMWTAGSKPMPTARGDAAVAVANKIIYVIGGSVTFQGERLNTVESYNPATGTWTEEAPMLLAKSEPAVGAFGNTKIGFTILSADGFNPNFGDTGDNEAYSVSGNSWSALKNDPEPRDEACYAATGSKLFVAGGVFNGSAPLNSTEAFSSTKKTWTSKAALPQPVTYAAGTAYKGLFYCFGGGSGNIFNGTYYNNLQIYHP